MLSIVMYKYARIADNVSKSIGEETQRVSVRLSIQYKGIAALNDWRRTRFFRLSLDCLHPSPPPPLPVN
jgi:hypothetical protein